MDPKKLKHIHFTGIKGVAMTALALCAQDLGIKVTGSDTEEVFVTDETLEKRGISWSVNFKKENLEPKPDLVVFTGAHGGLKNPEVQAAKNMGIPVVTHAEALAAFMEGKDGIITAGVGGKSTTAALIAHILDRAGKNPSFAVGVGNIEPIGVPGRYNKKGREFVTEGDEYVVSPQDRRPRFSLLSPKTAVITNIEHDHPDVYPNLAETMAAFEKFMEKIPSGGLLVANVGNNNIRNLLGSVEAPVETYGAEDADWRIDALSTYPGGMTFSLAGKGVVIDNLKISLPGRYNVLNAAAAFIVCNHLGVSAQKIKEALLDFEGTKRRFEKIGEAGGVLVYDDYAHHPIEIKAAIRAARDWYPERRLIVVFQPHTYSRTKALFAEFARALAQADVAAIMDIYSSAREEPDPEVSSQKLEEETAKYNKQVHYTKGHEETVRWLLENAKDGDVILTLGAGDIFCIHMELLERLRQKTESKKHNE